MYFQIYVDRAGRWRWRLISPGTTLTASRIIAESNEGFLYQQSCLDEIGLVKQSWNASVYQV